MYIQIYMPKLKNDIGTIKKIYKKDGERTDAGDKLVKIISKDGSEVIYAECCGMLEWDVEEGKSRGSEENIGRIILDGATQGVFINNETDQATSLVFSKKSL